MLAYLRRHHVALIALFFAFGGVSWAAADKLLPRNSVGTKQLRKNAVISSKVKDRSLLRRDFKPGQLPNGARGATGPPGLSGARGATGPKGDPTYKRTILVSPVGTDAQNGATLRAALAGITGNSVTDRFLIKIEPGTYDVGSTPLTMKPYVDLEGSGEDLTFINGSLTDNLFNQGVIVAASGVQLRDLSVKNTLAGETAVGTAIYANVSGFSLNRVTATALGGSDVVSFGLILDNASARISNSTLIGAINTCDLGGARGLWVRNASSTTTVLLTGTDVQAFNCGAIAAQMDGGTLKATWSRFGANDTSLSLSGSAEAYVRASEVKGAVALFDTATLACAQSFDGFAGELGASCT